MEKANNERIDKGRNTMDNDTPVEMILAESSNLESYGYDPDEQVMYIKYKHGGLYKFAGVLPDGFSGLRTAKSKGRHLHQMGIRGVKVN